jgi:hypothetical protein
LRPLMKRYSPLVRRKIETLRRLGQRVRAAA